MFLATVCFPPDSLQPFLSARLLSQPPQQGTWGTQVSTLRPTCCRPAKGRLAGPRVRIVSMALRSFESVKFCQMGSYSSLAFLPQTSVNSCLMSSVSSCGHQEGGWKEWSSSDRGHVGEAPSTES